MSTEPRIASREIEATLRLRRDAVERRIAAYRVALFAMFLFATLGIWLIEKWSAPFTPDQLPVPFHTFVFVGYTAWSLFLLRAVQRNGATDGVVYGSLVLDLVAPLVIDGFMIWSLSGLPENQFRLDLFTRYLAPPTLALILLINSLRNHPRASLLGAVIAPVVFVANVAIVIQEFEPPQAICAVVIAMAGFVAYLASRESRAGFELFARMSLLQRYLPPSHVQRVLREDPDAALALGGRLQTVTLLSTDLRGFTAMSERLSPGEVVEQLNAYHGLMHAEIDRHGGTLDKFMGDGALVVFGLEGSPADCGAAAAVECARTMLVALAAHNAARAAKNLPPLAMGAGIHTGPVVAGNIGAPERRLELTVIGDAVNTAARLESLTKEAKTPVLVSAETVANLPAGHGLRSLGAFDVRGKTEPVQLYGL